MALGYISPIIMNEYRQAVLRFAHGMSSLKCIRSHYLPDKSGACSLTGAREQTEIFVLQNRVNATMKVCPKGMQIVANVVDITDADQWYEHLKEQKKSEKDRLTQETLAYEEKKKAPRAVLIRRKPVELLDKNKNS